jgi:hypothetical protein
VGRKVFVVGPCYKRAAGSDLALLALLLVVVVVMGGCGVCACVCVGSLFFCCRLERVRSRVGLVPSKVVGRWRMPGDLGTPFEARQTLSWPSGGTQAVAMFVGTLLGRADGAADPIAWPRMTSD